jgi:hypothetical protein
MRRTLTLALIFVLYAIPFKAHCSNHHRSGNHEMFSQRSREGCFSTLISNKNSIKHIIKYK